MTRKEKITKILRQNEFYTNDRTNHLNKVADAIMALPIEVPSEEEQSIINDNKLQEIFNNSLTEKDKYSSNLNPFEIFKIGYVKGQVAKGIVVPNDYHIKANTPYYGKSCNKYWFEGAKWAINEILKRNGKENNG